LSFSLFFIIASTITKAQFSIIREIGLKSKQKDSIKTVNARLKKVTQRTIFEKRLENLEDKIRCVDNTIKKGAVENNDSIDNMIDSLMILRKKLMRLRKDFK